MRSLITTLSLLLLSVSALLANPLDSIGLRSHKGRMCIVHKVEKGQGLYAISKRYGVSTDTITKWNPEIAKGLKLGQELLIPMAAKKLQPVAGPKFPSDPNRKGNPGADGRGSDGMPGNGRGRPLEQATPDRGRQGKQGNPGTGNEKDYHIVGPKETLTRIALQHKLSLEELKRINELKDNNVRVGQKLLINPALYKAATVNMESAQTLNGQLLLDSKVDERKYLCYTNIVPEGKILKLVNPVNQSSVYVKVKAGLPQEDAAQIRITGAAMKKLGLEGNNSFSLEVHQSFQ